MVYSPILYSLFVEDLELYVQDKNTSGLNIDDIVLILLLFADDMIILGNSPEDLQNSLDLLYTYSQTWGLEVNTSKTKAMVFRKRGGLKEGEIWTYNGERLEVVNDFNYLGVVLNYTGTFNLNQQHLVGKGLKAMHVLISNCSKYMLKPKIMCQLFDTFVGSTLSYACEIWGFITAKDIERVHLRFCKRLLNVRLTTSNDGVYGELGRYPLYIARLVRIVKYWCKLVYTDNIIMSTMYKASVEDCERGLKNWASNVKTLLYHNGFGNIWENQNIYNLKTFYREFKQRLIDSFIQGWNLKINNNRVLNLYSSFKINFEYEFYLECLPTDLRSYLARIRLSSHALRIQTGRYAGQRVERNERKCLLCNNGDIEDEYHFVIICPIYTFLRRNFIKRYYYTRPSVYKFTQLMQSKNKQDMYNLAMFIKQAFTFRTSTININV